MAELDAIVPEGYPDAARDEVAVACKISDGEARKRLAAARALHALADTEGAVLPAAARALEEGSISLEHVHAITNAVWDLQPAEARWVEVAVLADTRARTPRQVAVWARRLALQVGAATAERCQADRCGRTLHAWSEHGRCYLSWSLSDADAAAVAARLDAAAVIEGPDDQRSAAQRRGDALFALVAGPGDDTGSGGLGRPHLDVVATHESLLDGAWRYGLGGGQLAGHIPGTDGGTSVFGEQLRELGCDADLRTTMINDFGTVIGQGRSSRVVSTRLRGVLDLRDQHCRFVGCTAPARRCHAHHIWHWADGGPTDPHNLILLCHRHHRAIHHGGWRVELGRDGSVSWTTPAGREVYTLADLDTLEPPPRPDWDDEHPAGGWIRPVREFWRVPDHPPGSEPRPEPIPGTTTVADDPPF